MLNSAQVLASTGGKVLDLAPYVPVLDPQGRAVFQATLASGESVICRDTAVVSPPGVIAASHPVDGARLAFFARTPTRTALCIDGRLDDTTLDFGPAGPTINTRGDVAARARDGDTEVIVLATTAGVEVVASGGPHDGLAVVLDEGTVVFHQRGIGLRRSGHAEPILRRDGLQRFFGANNRGQGAVATPRGIWCDDDLVIDGFEAYRAAALDDLGHVVHASAPAGGNLGVYSGRLRLVGLGDVVFGSTVVDLAFNQASLRADGRLAVRVKLADGRGLVLGWRLD